MGGKGESAKNVINDNMGIKMLEAQPGIISSPEVMEALKGYSSGKMSLQEAIGSVSGKFTPEKKSELSKAKQATMAKKAALAASGKHQTERAVETSGFMAGAKLPPIKSKEMYAAEKELHDIEAEEARLNEDAQYDRMRAHQLFSDPLTGTMAATEQVQNNPLFSGMFGKGGMQDRMFAEEQDLASRGYSLQPEDHEAYGQASDEIARMFGQEEGNLAQALAARGLAAAPSGAAQVGYSGLMGNKSERLASKQRQIANDRMEMNRQRLNDVRGMAMKSNQLAQGAIQDQYGRNNHGIESYQNALQSAVKAGQIKQGQENTAFDQVQATKGPSFGDFAMGVAGMGLGAMTGGAGKALGSAAGSTLSGALGMGDKKK